MRNAIYILLLTLLSIPGIIGVTCIFPEKPMHGDINMQDLYTPMDFCWEEWIEGSFQKELEKSSSAGSGLRNMLIRSANFINFWLLKTTDNENVIIGKNYCLYENDYLNAITGRNYCGEYFISHSIDNFIRVKKILKQKFGIELILVFEPGKAGTYPENIPVYEKRSGYKTDNYTGFITECKKRKLDYLDLQKYFLQLKDSSIYPLFSQYGVHWTTYGMYLAADTLLSYIEHAAGLKLSHFTIERIEMTDTTKDCDYDLEGTLNLLFDLPRQKFAMPIIKWDTSGYTKPNVLTIADSYLWSFFNNKIHHNAFSEKEYWYYYKTVYPHIWLNDAWWINDIDRKTILEKQDIVLFMITEMNLQRAFWGFPEEFISIYDSSFVPDKKYETMRFILNDEILFYKLFERSQFWGCGFDNALNIVAEKLMYYNDHLNEPESKYFWSVYNSMKSFKYK